MSARQPAPGSLAAEAYLELIRICSDAWPLETCGVIARSESASAPDRIIPIRNAHPNPVHSFAFDPAEWTAAFFDMQKNRQSLVGLYHSHPNQDAFPSERDKAGFVPASGVTYWIVSVHPGQKPLVQPYQLREGKLEAVLLVLA